MNISDLTDKIFSNIKEVFGRLIVTNLDKSEYENSPEYEQKNRISISKNSNPDFVYEGMIETIFSLRLATDFISALISEHLNKNIMQVIYRLPDEKVTTAVKRGFLESVNNPTIQAIAYELSQEGLKLEHIIIGPVHPEWGTNLDFASFDVRISNRIYISFVVKDKDGNLVDHPRGFGKLDFKVPKLIETNDLIKIVPNYHFDFSNCLLTIVDLADFSNPPLTFVDLCKEENVN